MNEAPNTTPPCDSADDCAHCGRHIDGSTAVEVGPNRFACSAPCAEALADAYCATCDSWLPDQYHAEWCERAYREDVFGDGQPDAWEVAS